jgi:5S rRNA maturation endonuclease (ribonuclease M5)
VTAAEFAALVPRAKRRADGVWWDGRCKAHDDRRSSLSWRDGDRAVITKCHAGCTIEHIASAFGVDVGALFYANGNGHHPPATTPRIVATYDYHDERGQVLYQVCRLEPKDFRMRRPGGTWDVKGVRRVVYRLPELAEAGRVYWTEGEKDADRLVGLGLRATTTPGGAANFRPEYAEPVKAAGVAEVIVLPDRDEAGDRYAEAVTRALLARGLRVKLVHLPGLAWQAKSGPDVSDWLDAGHTVAELAAVVDAAPRLESVPEAPGPRMTLTAEDGAIVWPDGAGVTFSRVTEGPRGVNAELAVTWGGRELDYGTLNLLSTRSRDGLAKKLERKVDAAPWGDYLDYACRAMVARIREGEPVVALEPEPVTRDLYLVAPVLPIGQTCVLFGDGGAGKSLVLLALMVSVATGRALPGLGRPTVTGPALVLDWESDRASWAELLGMVAAGLGVHAGDLAGRLHYRAMTSALADDARRVRADCAHLGVVLLGVDSLALASGAEPESADAAVRSLNTLRTVGPTVTRAVVAHVNKAMADQRGPSRPFGSVFVQNIARSTWEVRRTAEDMGDDLVLGLYHRKVNRGRLHSPLSLRAHFDADRITLHAGTLADAPDLLDRATTRQRIRVMLATGALTTDELAEALHPAPAKTVRRTLERMRDRYREVVNLPVQKPSDPLRWGLATRE